MKWKKPIIAILVAGILGTGMTTLLFKASYYFDDIDNSIIQYVFDLIMLALSLAIAFVQCLIGLHLTEGKEKFVVWVLAIYNALYFIVVFLFSVFLDGTGYMFLIAVLLCLLIPRYVLKHGDRINTVIVHKLEGLASEIEE